MVCKDSGQLLLRSLTKQFDSETKIWFDRNEFPTSVVTDVALTQMLCTGELKAGFTSMTEVVDKINHQLNMGPNQTNALLRVFLDAGGRSISDAYQKTQKAGKIDLSCEELMAAVKTGIDAPMSADYTFARAEVLLDGDLTRRYLDKLQALWWVNVGFGTLAYECQC